MSCQIWVSSLHCIQYFHWAEGFHLDRVNSEFVGEKRDVVQTDRHCAYLLLFFFFLVSSAFCCLPGKHENTHCADPCPFTSYNLSWEFSRVWGALRRHMLKTSHMHHLASTPAWCRKWKSLPAHFWSLLHRLLKTTKQKWKRNLSFFVFEKVIVVHN